MDNCAQPSLAEPTRFDVARRSLWPSLAVVGGAVMAWLWLLLTAAAFLLAGAHRDGLRGYETYAGLTAISALPCVPLAWMFSMVAMHLSRGDSLRSRSYSVALWTSLTPVAWGAGLGVFVGARSHDGVLGLGSFFAGAAVGLIVWVLTLTPVFSYALARHALRQDPGNGAERRREGRDAFDEDADVENLSARTAVRALFAKNDG